MKSGTSNKQNLIVSNISAQSSEVFLQSPVIITTSGDQLRFEDGIEIGSSATSATNLTDVAIGKGADATGGNSTALGQGAQATGATSIAIGYGSVASATDQIAFGDPTPASTTAVASAWGQTFQNRSWDDTTIQPAVINATGSIIKGVGSGSTIDFFCSNIANVQAIFVDQMFGKNSPINVEDDLNITSFGGAKITFESGIEIGASTTTAGGVSASIAIGKICVASSAK